MKHEGLRFNEGKLRYDLVQADAHEGMVRVLTFGANKYADRNWEKGMKWSYVLSSLKRHIAAIERGEDYDKESGLLHADHVACNAHFLSGYYRIYPQGDDRPHKYLKLMKVGLDIDEVIADCVGGLMRWFPEDMITRPKHWNDPMFGKLFPLVKDNANFWLSLEPKMDPSTLPFEPHCYITSRPCDTAVTKEWLDYHGFPVAPIHTVGLGGSKIEVAKSSGIDVFVDDCYKNFVELNNAGIFTFLMTATHNEKYNVGFRRIQTLHDLPFLKP